MLSDANPHESKVLALAIACKPGETFCSTWNVTARNGEMIRVSFTARAAVEPCKDGTHHLIARAMNWRSPYEPCPESDTPLAQQILRGMAQEGVQRALVDLRNWRLLKRLDPPNPHVDWRGEDRGRPLVHPDDNSRLQSMIVQFVRGPASAVLRLRSRARGWVLVHVTVYRVELSDGVYAGLISTRLPTPAELASVSALDTTLSSTEVVSDDTSGGCTVAGDDFVGSRKVAFLVVARIHN